ncbi:MAG: VanZ family protein [Psychroserpens sp.]|nr:VanZ family protein [Psychroserpens sp.]
MNLKDVPSTGLSNEDKVFHTIAYFIFAVLVYNFLWSKHIKRAILLSVIIVTTYGIIIEVLQFVLTTHRSFDLYDALANFSGALLASILLKVRHNRKLNLN